MWESLLEEQGIGGIRILTVVAVCCPPARHHALGALDGTVKSNFDGPHRVRITDFSVHFDEHQIIGVARMGVTRVGDGFDSLKHLLPGLVDRRHGVVAQTDSEHSEEYGNDHSQPGTLSPCPRQSQSLL